MSEAENAKRKAAVKVLLGTTAVALLLASSSFGLSGGSSATVAAMGMLLLPWILAPKDSPPSFRFGYRSDFIPLLKWTLVLLPLFLVGFHIWQSLVPGRELQFELNSERLGVLDVELVLVQILAIALPEEYFFRGFVQPTLARHVGVLRIPGLKLQLSWAIIIASALFALVHLIAIPSPFRLAVFFPGIIFGLMYERSGSLAQPILFHAGSNLVLVLCNAIWGLSG